MYFAPMLKGFPSDFGTGAMSRETRMMGPLDRERSLTISFSHLDVIYQHDRGTNGPLMTAKTVLTHSVAWQKMSEYAADIDS